MIERAIKESPLPGLLLPWLTRNLQTYYSRFYTEGGFKKESPLKTIEQIMDRIITVAGNNFTGPYCMLDIGSGPQYLVYQLLTNYPELFNRWQIHTVDFANIPSQDLMAKRFPNVTHWEQSATCLPFPNDHFGLVVSNFALDLMPHNAYCEMARVLAPGGIALLHFHHPSPAYTSDPPYLWMRLFSDVTKQKYGRPYAYEDTITEEFHRVGLIISNPIVKDSWENDSGRTIEYWQVSATK